MSLVSLVILLVVVGLVLYFINAFMPLQPPFKQIINVIVVLVVCLWLLQQFGIISGHAIRLR